MRAESEQMPRQAGKHSMQEASSATALRVSVEAVLTRSIRGQKWSPPLSEAPQRVNVFQVGLRLFIFTCRRRARTGNHSSEQGHKHAWATSLPVHLAPSA